MTVSANDEVFAPATTTRGFQRGFVLRVLLVRLPDYAFAISGIYFWLMRVVTEFRDAHDADGLPSRFGSLIPRAEYKCQGSRGDPCLDAAIGIWATFTID
jgi:hypothetical protein